MLRILSTALFCCCPILASAQETTSIVGAHGATTPGSYMGLRDGAEVHLDLWPDQSFHMNSGDNSHAGRWFADPGHNGLVLDLSKGLSVFEVRNAQRLRSQDAPEDGAQDLVLSETFSPASIRLPMSGMLTYFADAATIVHCATGRVHPVAQDGDYLALERAYLEDRPGPAEPLFVTMDAVIETREQMEGPDRLTVVPVVFGGTFGGEDCSLGNRVLGLHDAVWTILSIDGVEIDSSIVSREPSLTFNAKDETFFASVGCNTLRGGFSASASDLDFAQPLASTMMACPDPVADWETRLGEALARVASYEIGGKSLRLLGEDGARLANLRAVYLP
jgi:heat shock protein HslJ